MTVTDGQSCRRLAHDHHPRACSGSGPGQLFEAASGFGMTDPAADAENEPGSDRGLSRKQRRAHKAAARAQRRTARARLEAETVGEQLGYTVFVDGTVGKLPSSRMTTWADTNLAKRGLRRSTAGRLPRSRVVDVAFEDRRKRKWFHRTRTAAHTARAVIDPYYVGFGSVSKYSGVASLVITTDRWIETVKAQSDDEVAKLETLHGLLRRAKCVSESSSQSPKARPDQPSASANLPDAHQDLVGTGHATPRAFDDHEAQGSVIARIPPLGPVSTPAGWHPDPYLIARLRWWDGHAWTGHTAP